jgi:hypothetical protein
VNQDIFSQMRKAQESKTMQSPKKIFSKSIAVGKNLAVGSRAKFVVGVFLAGGFI